MRIRARGMLAAFVLFMCVVLGGLAPKVALADAPTDARHGVVCITEEGVVQFADGTGYEGDLFGGTGFFVGKQGENPEYIVTNYHVVQDMVESKGEPYLYDASTAIRIDELRVYFDDNDHVKAHVVASDDVKDIAVLKIDKPTDKRAPLSICVPDDSVVGKTVYTVGYPGVDYLAQTTTSMTEEDAKFSQGIVSKLAIQDNPYRKVIQTDAEIYHGNSGGPMLLENGGVIGINTLRYTGDQAQDAKFAIDISEAISLLDNNKIPYTTIGINDGKGVSLPIVPIAIAAGAVVIIVAVVLVVRSRTKKQTPQPQMAAAAPVVAQAPAPAPMPAPVQSALPNDSGYRVQCVDGAVKGMRVMIPTSGRLVIGRDASTCGMVIPNNTPGVSGRHCEVWVEGGAVMLQDLGSTHGTFVSPGRKLSAQSPVGLTEDETFWLGSKSESFVISRKQMS